MCMNCGLGCLFKPIGKSNIVWQYGHIYSTFYFFRNTPKVTAILVPKSPGDTVILESITSRYGVEGCNSSKYDSLKINRFSHAPKSDVINDAMVIRAIACGLICYWD